LLKIISLNSFYFLFLVILIVIDVRNVLIEFDGVLKLHMHSFFFSKQRSHYRCANEKHRICPQKYGKSDLDRSNRLGRRTPEHNENYVWPSSMLSTGTGEHQIPMLSWTVSRLLTFGPIQTQIPNTLFFILLVIVLKVINTKFFRKFTGQSMHNFMESI
jgi:hypothetical protein